MPKIFQRFDLVKEKMEEFIREERASSNPSTQLESGRAIRKELSKRGYDVLFSNVSYCGVPESIIMGGEFGKMHKDDFYSVAGKLGLFFKSGDCYLT